MNTSHDYVQLVNLSDMMHGIKLQTCPYLYWLILKVYSNRLLSGIRNSSHLRIMLWMYDFLCPSQVDMICFCWLAKKACQEYSQLVISVWHCNGYIFCFGHYQITVTCVICLHVLEFTFIDNDIGDIKTCWKKSCKEPNIRSDSSVLAICTYVLYFSPCNEIENVQKV